MIFWDQINDPDEDSESELDEAAVVDSTDDETTDDDDV